MKQTTFHNRTDAPQVHRLSESCLDHKIDALLGAFAMSNLETDSQKRFFEIYDRGEQVDQACWRLAAGVERHSAVSLRALFTVRHMDVATKQRVVQPWVFNLPVCDPFWASVDEAMSAYIKKFGDESPVSPPTPPAENTTVVGSINGYPILREVMQHEGQPPFNVVYSIECPEADAKDLSA